MPVIKHEPDFAELVDMAAERRNFTTENWNKAISELYGATIDPITAAFRRIFGKNVSSSEKAVNDINPSDNEVPATLRSSSLAYMLVIGPLMYPRSFVIFFAILTLLLRLSDHRLRESTASFSDNLDLLINAYFLFEGFLRLSTIPAVFEIRKRHFATDIQPANSLTYEILRCGWIEILISLLSIAIMFQYDSTNAICWFNLFRLAFIASFYVLELPQIEVLLSGIYSGFRAIISTWFLLIVTFVIYGVLCTAAFRDNDPARFSTVGTSMFSLFRVSTMDNWSQVNYINAYGCDVVDSEYFRIPKDDPRPRYVDVFAGRMYLFYCDSPASLPYLSSFVFVSFVVLTGFMLISLTVAAVSDGVHLRLLEIQKQQQEDEEYDKDEEMLENLLDAELPDNSSVVSDERKEQLMSKLKKFAFNKSQTGIILQQKLKQQEDKKVDFVVTNSSSNGLTDVMNFHSESKTSDVGEIVRMESLVEEEEEHSFPRKYSHPKSSIKSKISSVSVEADCKVLDFEDEQRMSSNITFPSKAPQNPDIIHSNSSSSIDSVDSHLSYSISSSEDSADLSIMPSIVIRVVTSEVCVPNKQESLEKIPLSKVEDNRFPTAPSSPASPPPTIRKTISGDRKTLRAKTLPRKSGIVNEKLPLLEDQELLLMMLNQMWSDVEKEKAKRLESPSLDESFEDKQSPHSSKLNSILSPQESIRSLSASPHSRTAQRRVSISKEGDPLTFSSTKKFAYLFRNIMSTYYYMMYIIIIVLVTAGVEIYCTNKNNCRHYWGLFIAVQILLTVDILSRILTYYPTYKTFFYSHLNLIDLGMVLTIWIPIFYRGYGANVAESARIVYLLRLLPLLSWISDLQVIILSIQSSLRPLLYVVGMMFLMFFHFSVAGVLLFKQNDQFYFGTLFRAMVSLSQICTLDNWGDIALKNMYGCDYYGSNTGVDKFDAMCTDSHGLGWVAAWYFIIFITLSVMILQSLFVGIIISATELLKDSVTQEADMWKIIHQRIQKYGLQNSTVTNLLDIFNALDLQLNGLLTEKEIEPLLKFLPPIKNLSSLIAQVECKVKGNLNFAEFIDFVHLLGIRTNVYKPSFKSNKVAPSLASIRPK